MHLCIPALFGRHAPELWPQRTANNQPFLSPRESDIEKPPMLLHLSLLAFPGCFLDRSELFRAAGRQNRQFAPARLKLPIETAHIAHALGRSEEHTSELQSLMRISYAVFCLKKKKQNDHQIPVKPYTY